MPISMPGSFNSNIVLYILSKIPTQKDSFFLPSIFFSFLPSFLPSPSNSEHIVNRKKGYSPTLLTLTTPNLQLKAQSFGVINHILTEIRDYARYEASFLPFESGMHAFMLPW